jgi:5-methyltetrahydrofolate--homocysteine methyltransferase
MAIDEIWKAVLEGDEAASPRLVAAELRSGTDPSRILKEALVSAMDEAGARMSTGEMFIPEVLAAADAMKAAMDVLSPHLTGEAGDVRATVVVGAVEGDIHDIGKSLVALMLDGAGFDVVDLGVDVKAATFVEKAREHGASIVGMSSLMVTTMPKMKEVIAALRDADLTAKLIVGGAPLTQAYADEIGADGYAPDAGGAVQLVKRLAL